MALEDELLTCPACAGMGTVAGDRCDECKGRGITRVAAPMLVIPEIDDAPEEDEGDGLDTMSLAALREHAEILGLSPDGAKEQLIKRIQKGQADPPSVPEDEAPEDGLDRLTVAQLREKADELGLDASGRKAELLALIRGAAVTTEAPGV